MPKLTDQERKRFNIKQPAKPAPKPANDPLGIKGPVEQKVGANIDGIWTFLTVPGMIMPTTYSDYTHKRTPACIDLAKCKELYKACSKADKERMTAFVKANSHTVKYQRHWYMIQIHNLDTGRKFWCIGYKLDGPGLTLKQIETLIRGK